MEIGGDPWHQTIAKARLVDPNVREYRSADIPMVLVETLKDKKGNVVAEAGKLLGYSLSTTNWRPFEKFMRAVVDHGLAKSRIRVMLGYEPTTNPKGNKWGVVTFELIGGAD